MTKQEILAKLQRLIDRWDGDDCIDFAYDAIETVEEIVDVCNQE